MGGGCLFLWWGLLGVVRNFGGPSAPPPGWPGCCVRGDLGGGGGGVAILLCFVSFSLKRIKVDYWEGPTSEPSSISIPNVTALMWWAAPAVHCLFTHTHTHTHRKRQTCTHTHTHTHTHYRTLPMCFGRYVCCGHAQQFWVENVDD